MIDHDTATGEEAATITSDGAVEVLIDGLGASGDGVGRLSDGRVVFVPRALPGDTVRILLGATKKKVQYGDLIRVVRASSDRVDSRCKLANCGGCPIKGLSLPAQSKWKRARVVETLRRIGHVNIEPLLGPVWQVGDGWRYRHRVRLHAAYRDGGWRLGYHERRSREMVPLSDCPVLWHELEQLALNVGAVVRPLPEALGLQTVELAYSRRDGRGAGRFLLSGSVAPLRERLAELGRAGMVGVDIEGPGERVRHGNLELRYDIDSNDYDLRFEPGTFTQAHPGANAKLVAQVVSWLRPRAEHILELHSGIGNFSVPLARTSAKLRTVERDKRATILARQNARRAGVNVDSIEGDDANAELWGDLTQYDAVLLDPPRTGAREVVEQLARGGPPRLVYVSCDAATLARDAAILLDAGYVPAGAEIFDMFPETPHVEVVLVMDRAKGTS